MKRHLQVHEVKFTVLSSRKRFTINGDIIIRYCTIMSQEVRWLSALKMFNMEDYFGSTP